MRLALDPPKGSLVRISRALLDEACAASRASPRLRVILPLHTTADNSLHRMLNAVQPHSYIRPHRHRSPLKDESFVLIRGALVFFSFHDDGRIDEAVEVRAGGLTFGIDAKAGPFHSFAALEADTVIFETKPGPYVQANDKSFAPWAPEEGSPEAAPYLAQLLLHPRTT